MWDSILTTYRATRIRYKGTTKAARDVILAQKMIQSSSIIGSINIIFTNYNNIIISMLFFLYPLETGIA